MAQAMTPLSPDPYRGRTMLRERRDRAVTGAGDDLAGNGHDQASLSELLKDAFSETTELVRSELQVFRLEVQESARAVARDTVKVAVGAGAALLGGLCLVAFMVLGLGALLTNWMTPVNAYWVSALSLAVLFGGVGALLMVRYSKRIGEDVKLTETQKELERDKRLLQTERRVFREAVRP